MCCLTRRIPWIAILFLCLALTALRAADGDLIWNPAGLQTVQGTATQTVFHVADAPDGGVVIAFREASGDDLYVQRLNAYGATQWANGVQVTATAGQFAITDDRSTGSFVVWEQVGVGLFAQHLDIDGSALWNPAGVKVGNGSPHPAAQAYPHVVADGSGGVFTGWIDSLVVTGSLRLAHVDSSGTVTAPGVDGIVLGTTTSSAYDMTEDGAGGVIAIWNDNDDLVAQRVNNGLPWGVTPVAIADETRREIKPVAINGGSVGAIVAFQSSNGDTQLRVQRIDANGNRLWLTTGVVLADSDDTGGIPGYWALGMDPDVASDGSNGAIIAWTDYRESDPGGDSDIYTQRVDHTGAKRWGVWGVSMTPGPVARFQRDPWIVEDGEGGAIAVFDMNGTEYDIGAARIDADGNLHWSHPVYEDAATRQEHPEVVFDAAGPSPLGAVVVWKDDRNQPTDFGDFYAQKVEISHPGHDECVDGIPLAPGSFENTLAGGTLDGETSCGGTDSDVWFRFTAPADGLIGVNTCGTNDWPGEDNGIDTVLSLHVACPGNVANELACNDDWNLGSDPTACSGIDGGAVRDSALSAFLGEGETVFIRVSRYVNSTNGSFLLNVLFAPQPPPHDACADAAPLGEGQVAGSTYGATNDGDSACASPGGGDVWYRFTPEYGGDLQVDTCGTHDLFTPDSGIDTVVSVHGACPGTGANEISCNHNWPDGDLPTACAGEDAGTALDSAVAVPVRADETVWIRVARHPASPDGEFLLRLEALYPPAGVVPDGSLVPGSMLEVERLPNGDLLMTWDLSCLPDPDYEVYEGLLGDTASLVPVTCGTAGATIWQFTPRTESAYYLVVPTNGANEGSYGAMLLPGGTLAERPQSPSACHSQLMGACP